MMSVSAVDVAIYEWRSDGVETLADRVKRLRGKKSLDRLAKDTGLTRDAIWRIETGRTDSPRYDTLEKLSDAFGVSIDQLLNPVLSALTGRDLQITSVTAQQPAASPPSSDAQTNPKQFFEIRAAVATVPHLARLDIAERWSDLDVVSGPDVSGPGEENWLIVAIAGDSMEPRIRDGQQVLFRMLGKDEKPLAGYDYLIIRQDKSGTLRRVSKVSKEGYELTAANDKYSTLSVSMDEVAMVGEPRFVVTNYPV